MKKDYFTLDENFERIIKKSLPDKAINSITSITTGWTNIVFEVCTNCGNFFFRFPRDDFWIRTIVKDYEFAKFIYGKTDFNTVNLNYCMITTVLLVCIKRLKGQFLQVK